MSTSWVAAESALHAAELFQRAEEDGAACRLVWGQHMADSSAILGHFAAAMQFPPYFGHNWHAFDESFGEFSDAAQRLTVIILDAQHVGAADADGLRDLVTSLNYAGGDLEASGPDAMLTVVVASGKESDLDRWIDAGASFGSARENTSDG